MELNPQPFPTSATADQCRGLVRGSCERTSREHCAGSFEPLRYHKLPVRATNPTVTGLCLVVSPPPEGKWCWACISILRMGTPGKSYEAGKQGSHYRDPSRKHRAQHLYQQPYVERQLTVLGWADSHVFGQIPADISGVIDGPATLEIWRSDESKSSPLAIHFTAARDLEILPLVDTTLVSARRLPTAICAISGQTLLS